MANAYDSNSQKRELKQLYKYFPEVKRLLISLGCDKETTEDLFQEALIIYVSKKKDPTFKFELEPIHFVKQTSKLLWYNEARKRQKQASTFIPHTELEEDWLNKELLYQQLEIAIDKIGKQCKELLQLFYGLGKSMVEVAQQLNLRNEHVAKSQKYRCLQKAKELVKEEEALLNINQF